MNDNKQTPSEFAFGANELAGCECPAKSAGIDPSSREIHRVVKRYDCKMEERTGVWDGTTDEETAEEAWLAAVDAVSSRNYDEETVEQIMNDLGWDGEY